MAPGVWNFRDAAAGAALRPGLFFRSSELNRLDEAGWESIQRLGVADIADLRSQREIERAGSCLLPVGVAVHHLPFPATAVNGGEAPHEASFQRVMQESNGDDVALLAQRFMTEEYQRFATLPGARRAVRQVISLLADERPVIVHCFAGKDRTGFVVALVLETAGVDPEAIVADFMRSNDSLTELRGHVLESVRERAADYPELADSATWLSEDILGVREEYLDAARRAVDSHYGSLDKFLAAADVTPDDIERLRAALLR
ncbi:tyrosine-protein phosphatase [Mycobacterium sp. E1747]|uniref:tyrosine-protein phosphatase n=1 Tax=Mycobacterium sp. E1747 TaxID=1834128 RepID=UPI0018D4C366|nr:tyrosine-protein phosphatase [Mycobacterium sp. E1747]